MAVSLSSRFWRALLIGLAGWLMLEFALMQLVAERIGWGAMLAFLAVKGGIGLLLVGAIVARGLRRLGRGMLVTGTAGMGFGVASAVLITLPGLLPAFVGVALFSPSLRAALLRRLKARNAPDPTPRNIDLSEEDWRELKTRRIARKTKPRPKADTADALEAKPPSV